jgi:enamine deaminase RidA (YjgF/YER057c/UK114 family)
MAYTTIVPEKAKPIANYKMATRYESGRLVYLSAQAAHDADGNIVGKGDIRIQTRQIYQNMRRILQEAGGDLSDLIKITTWITRMEDFPASKEARDEFLPDAPAATLLEVLRLFHPDLLIQVEGVAVVDESPLWFQTVFG